MVLSLCMGMGFLSSQTYSNAWVAPICLDGDISCTRTMEVSVSLYNSYSASLAFNSWTNNRVISWWTIWIGQANTLLTLSANSTSTYIISWWETKELWSWVWIYTNSQIVNLGNEWSHSIQAEFNKSWEFLYSNTLILHTDYTSPNVVTNTSMPDNTLFIGATWSLSWTQSIDTGVWLAWYYLYISLNPAFPDIIPLRITGNNREFNSNNLPKWTLFYKIVAVDYLWHESSSSTHYFNNQTPTLIGNNGWWFNIQNNQNNQNNQNITTSQEGMEAISSIHPITEKWYTQKKVFNSNDKDLNLKVYLVENFSEHGVANRILPEVMPETWVDGYENLSKDDIEKELYPQNYFKNRNIYSIVSIIALMILSFIFYIYKVRRYKKKIKILDN